MLHRQRALHANICHKKQSIAGIETNVEMYKPTCHHEAVLPLGLSWQQRVAALERLMRPQELEPCFDRICTAHRFSDPEEAPQLSFC
jgi:hypothetical protein